MRRSKFGNKKIMVDGIQFDSRKEAKFYLFLKEAQKNGEIRDLRLQVPYELIPAIYEDQVVHLKTKDKIVSKCVQKAVHYVADFVYYDNATGLEEVVDVKSEITRKHPVYLLKKKMMRAFKGIAINEV